MRKRAAIEPGTGARLLVATLLLSLITLLQPLLLAQEELGERARQALREGQQRAAQAMTAYPEHYPDLPLWREAIDLGLQAQRLAPERSEPYRFLGQVYSTTGWYSRAWSAWRMYLERGGEADAQTRAQLLAAATWLGFNTYSAGSYRQALPYLEEALRLNPGDRLTTRRIARAYLEIGDPESARPYAKSLAELDPDSSDLLALVDLYLSFGIEAVDAVRAGEEQYGAGRLEEALESFRTAVEANPRYGDALRWASRVALELDRPGVAVPYLESLAQLEPENENVLQRLEAARAMDRYGPQAYRDYQQALEAYGSGDGDTAYRLLEAAVNRNSEFADAHAWLGRLDYERGRYQEALRRFQLAVRHNPGESRYRFFLSDAERQLRRAEQARERAQAREQAEEEAAEQARAQEEALERARAEQQARNEAEALERRRQQEREEAARVAQAEAAAQAQEAERTESAQAQTEPTRPETAAPETAATEAAATQPPREEAEPEARGSTQPEGATVPAETTAETAEDAPETMAAAPAAPAQSPAGGAPLVIVDRTIEHQSADEGGTGAFSFLPNPALERDLSRPVPYSTGTLFLRLEVLSKPSDASVNYQLCLVPNDSISVQPACTPGNAMSFTHSGAFEAQVALEQLNGYGALDWRKGLESVILVIKDGNGLPIDSRYALGDGSEPLDASLYYPMEVRLTAVLVPPGSSFAGWPQ